MSDGGGRGGGERKRSGTTPQPNTAGGVNMRCDGKTIETIERCGWCVQRGRRGRGRRRRRGGGGGGRGEGKHGVFTLCCHRCGKAAAAGRRNQPPMLIVVRVKRGAHRTACTACTAAVHSVYTEQPFELFHPGF